MVFLVEFSLTDHMVGFEVLNIPKMIIFIHMDNNFEQSDNTSFLGSTIEKLSCDWTNSGQNLPMWAILVPAVPLCED